MRSRGNLLSDAALTGAASYAAVSSQLRIPSLTPSQNSPNRSKRAQQTVLKAVARSTFGA